MDTTTIVILVLVGLGLLGAVFWWRSTRTPEEEPVYHFACPNCSRRLRYKARQVGHQGQCPQCGAGLTFPRA